MNRFISGFDFLHSTMRKRGPGGWNPFKAGQSCWEQCSFPGSYYSANWWRIEKGAEHFPLPLHPAPVLSAMSLFSLYAFNFLSLASHLSYPPKHSKSSFISGYLPRLEESWWLPWDHYGRIGPLPPASYYIPSWLHFSKLCLPLSFCTHLCLYSQLHLLLISVGCYLIFWPSYFSFLIFWVLLSFICYIIITILWDLNMQEGHLCNFFLYNPAQKYM